MPFADGPSGYARRRAIAFDETMAKTNPFEFLQQVRNEGSKVTWPTRKETMITTAMVFVMVVLASLFFLIVDQVIRFGVGLALGIGS